MRFAFIRPRVFVASWLKYFGFVFYTGTLQEGGVQMAYRCKKILHSWIYKGF